MVGISDAVVIGIVLGLVFAAVSYYLYSRVLQLEKKVGLMENILLDLKVTTEQTLLAEIGTPPVRSRMQMNEMHEMHQMHQMDESDESDELPRLAGSTPLPTDNLVEGELGENDNTGIDADDLNVRDVRVESSRSTSSSSSKTYSVVRQEDDGTSQSTSQSTVQDKENTKNTVPSINYEANTYKELLGIARQKGVTGGSHMTKSELIASLRRKDSGEPVKNVPAAWSALLSGISGGNVQHQNEDGVQAELLPADPNTDGADIEDNSPLDENEIDSTFVQ